MQNKIKLENWSIVAFNRLVGSAYGHPRFPDGRPVWTSEIVRVDLINMEVYTYSGSCYELGKVDPYRDQWEELSKLLKLAKKLENKSEV